MFVELLLVLLALAAALAPLIVPRDVAGRKGKLAGFYVVLAVALLAWFSRDTEPGWLPEEELPHIESHDGYVSSDSCRACHPSEFKSWHDSYHRTMTQVATADTVVAPWPGWELSGRGRSYRLYKKGEEFWVEMGDPDWEVARQSGEPLETEVQPRVHRPVVMTTGSHHQQAYWVPLKKGRGLYQIPFNWIIESERWIPREDAFLAPPGLGGQLAIWNAKCIRCHSTGGVPDLDFDTMTLDSTVAELGIACEECHGPGEAHVEFHRNPLNRYGSHLGGAVESEGATPDHRMANPAKLDQARSSEVCGQCHVFAVFKEERGYLERGKSFRPGQHLSDSRGVLTLDNDEGHKGEKFWKDGQCRVGGREYNGMVDSRCYDGGEMTCLSCHSLHRGDPNDQLDPDKLGDLSCTQCHVEPAYRTASHTHHSVGSSGSSCLNCHMPHTSYALLKAIRSHTVSSPRVRELSDIGRPNACNLCHLDRTLGWTSKYMQKWYGHGPAELTFEEENVAASVVWAVKGDALQRALTAWHYGWAPAKHASGVGSLGSDWVQPFLGELLADDYTAVRYIALRSLRRFQAYEKLDYPVAGVQADWRGGRDRALARWRSTSLKPAGEDTARLLLDESGDIIGFQFAELLSRRDKTPIFIAE